MKKKFLLRLSPQLWNDLERWAADDFRSVNAQIEFLLQQATSKRRGAEKKEEDKDEG